MAAGCQQARMEIRGAASSNGALGIPTPSPTPGPLPGPTQANSETFTASQLGGKVDILFVDDNSASMDVNETNLGGKFTSLSSVMTKVDWHLGVTTTDCGADQWGVCGTLLTLAGMGSTYSGGITTLSVNTPNYASVFANTVVRPETVGCVARGACPDGDSTPLKATLNAMVKSASANAGFFRNGADLAVVILTNADEDDNAPTAGSTTPQQVVNQFNALWGTTKKLHVYTIGVLPADSGCLSEQAQTGISAAATYPVALSQLTGGLEQSICATDYAGTMQAIGDDIESTVSSSFNLAHVPAANTVTVSFNPALTGVTWTLSGNEITFGGTSIPVGTQISVSYQY